jgi:hypothetical protein
MIAIWIPSVGLGEPRCPREIPPVEYQALEHSQIGVPVMINGRGPFEFMLDTGAQITIVDSTLASELDVHPEGTIGIVSVAHHAQADVVNLESLETGRHEVWNLRVAVQSLDQIRVLNPQVHGILGEDFLARFDLLIDNAHKVVCLDETRQMQQAILGERSAVLQEGVANRNLPFSQPVLVSIHLHGDRRQGTVMKLDSGSSAPVLFSSQGEILPWLQKMHASRGSVSGRHEEISLAAMPAQSVRITDHLERQIAFLTPISNETLYAKTGEGGLLPTALFKEIFISVRDGFVVFDPRDACPHAESKKSAEF